MLEGIQAQQVNVEQATSIASELINHTADVACKVPIKHGASSEIKAWWSKYWRVKHEIPRSMNKRAKCLLYWVLFKLASWTNQFIGAQCCDRSTARAGKSKGRGFAVVADEVLASPHERLKLRVTLNRSFTNSTARQWGVPDFCWPCLCASSSKLNEYWCPVSRYERGGRRN